MVTEDHHHHELRGRKRYRIEKFISEGTYGKVFLAKDLSNGEDVAIKRLKTAAASAGTSGGGIGGIHFTCIREMKVMKAVHSENVMSLVDVFASINEDEASAEESASTATPRHKQPQLSLVMKFMHCDLKKVLSSRNVTLSLPCIKAMVYQIVSGVKALHDVWFVHRDLSSGNVLCDINTGTLSLTDFGLARQLGQPPPGCFGQSKRSFGGNMTFNVVTLWYRAPELLFESSYYSPAVDIWSIGTLMAEMLPRGERSRPSTVKRRAPLFQVPSEVDLLKAIVELLGTPSEQAWPEASSLPSFHEFAYLPEPDNWPRDMFGDACRESDKLDEFLKSMLMLNPTARPSSAELLKHDYFTLGHPTMASKGEVAKALRPAVGG
ncbi:protein kinase 1, putative [Perkinsus marinus ATCC 50983]|uniref:Cyclin-dependent kinase 2 homolog n=1 Tax=Perkinsus marinus (strain ATCC 50983 / TXsc) TaxID=423536 RepID=C5K601_PERM5|nr:protein kinase 1, putative [Perkinsus marinus ATCC 50983]EER20031.1 protein kinase 1, putative [Perkinsus marinus ATCC 50983]|eukprot:XP_002788235.1 protein kinase 1, putative [Perkinsus marinus ATCC 50983]